MKCQCCPHIETSQLICTANQLTGFYLKATLALNGLKWLTPNTITDRQFNAKLSQFYFLSVSWQRLHRTPPKKVLCKFRLSFPLERDFFELP